IGASGTLNINGGTFNQSTVSASGANLVIGSFSGVTGAVNVSSGALNLDNGANINFSDTNAVSPNGTLTISGGAVTFYSNAGTTVGGTGVVDLMKGTGTGTNTINLNGGTLTANQIKNTSATGTRVVNFNGGTLKSGSSSLAATFFASGVATTANVRNGGAVIDTNGNSVTIGQALVHSTIGGDNATDGGLTKNGAGTLTLSSGANTYTGATTINVGTLTLASTGSIASSASIAIKAGATLNTAAQSFALSSSQPITFTLDPTGSGSAGSISAAALDITNGNVTFSTTGTLDDAVYTIASYSSLAGTNFASVTNLPSGYALNYNYLGGNVIALVAVPESHEFAIAIVGLLCVMVVIRRRKIEEGN
ncbi:MAG TPA: autotransporter-associated beta strand repeat-containing protein, partial [Chthoniobacterales bacterium]